MKNIIAATAPAELPKNFSLRFEFIRFIDSLQLTGLNSLIAAEARGACERALEQIEQKPNVLVTLRGLQKSDPGLLEHSYLTAFLTAVISQNISWSTPRTTELALISALLHDIGLHYLPVEIASKPMSRFTPDDLTVYKTHTQLAADQIRRWHLPEPVAQVALQHHECIDGSGYPFATSANQIYPLAKIVSLANSFTEHFMNDAAPIVQSLKSFASNKTILEQYDGDALRALIKGFIKGK